MVEVSAFIYNHNYFQAGILPQTKSQGFFLNFICLYIYIILRYFPIKECLHSVGRTKRGIEKTGKMKRRDFFINQSKIIFTLGL